MFFYSLTANRVEKQFSDVQILATTPRTVEHERVSVQLDKS